MNFGKGVARIMHIFSNLYKTVKKEPTQRDLDKQLTVSVWTPGGSDGCPAALELAHYYAETTQEKVALVEFPCLGIPRLAIHVDLYDKEKNTDKLLLDFERSEYTGIYPAKYLLPVTDLISVLVNNPYGTPDLSISLKLNNLVTLTDFPCYLKNNLFLEGYKLIIYILQGQLHHPLTFFGLRESDQVIFNVDFPIETGWCLSCFKKLTDTYNQSAEKFALYSAVLEPKALSGITSMRYLKSISDVFNYA